MSKPEYIIVISNGQNNPKVHDGKALVDSFLAKMPYIRAKTQLLLQYNIGIRLENKEHYYGINRFT